MLCECQEHATKVNTDFKLCPEERRQNDVQLDNWNAAEDTGE